MFRIGEFAQIAQVSSRQLRFYDQLGILQPAYVDAQTGYRYYGVQQLPRLNRILALKEMGLSLEEIAPLLNQDITAMQLRAMLAQKRAQIQQTLHEEETRLRHIESRIALIDSSGDIEGFDVVAKSVAAVPFLSVRCSCAGMNQAVQMLRRVAVGVERQVRPELRDQLIVVAHNEQVLDELDLEIGVSLARRGAIAGDVQIGELMLSVGQLPAVELAATLIRQGTNEQSHAAFGALGVWIEANGFEIAGPCREVFLESVSGTGGVEAALVEIQFPVRSRPEQADKAR